MQFSSGDRVIVHDGATSSFSPVPMVGDREGIFESGPDANGDVTVRVAMGLRFQVLPKYVTHYGPDAPVDIVRI
ncbi:hypothetical protein [Streptomyces sp. NPDC057748]|uniref:hypothetical protein n=1 Tax=unclassified Streptomyces TaxID=2593676 RepID=UPI0036AA0306